MTAIKNNLNSKPKKIDMNRWTYTPNIDVEKLCRDPIKDHIRLNLPSVENLPEMLIDSYKKFYSINIEDLEINIRYDNVSNSHSCPLGGITNWGGLIEGAPRNYPGWVGQISFFAKSETINTSDRFAYLPDVISNSYFRGLHLGGGCPGRLNQYKTNSAFLLFLQDFPILVKNKEKENLLRSFENNRKEFTIFKYSALNMV